MPRLNIPLSVSIQFDNPVQPPAYGAAAIMTSVSLATNDAGQAVAQLVRLFVVLHHGCHLRAACHQQLGCRQADARAGSGDHGAAASQFQWFGHKGHRPR